MITAKSLIKTFGTFRAVDHLDLHIRQGECFGLLGPNGAGKSTFIGMIYGAIERSSGELSIFGFDPKTHGRDIKKRLGVVTQDNALDENLTVIENMMIYGAFIGLPKERRQQRIEELLEYMNLAHKRDALIQTLSGGMKRRLVFVRALLGSPELLILDEPTTGLDPAVRHLLWNKVKELRQGGTTILLTTHYMHEAEMLCDRLAIMNGGKVVTEGSPRDLIQAHAPGFVGIFPRDGLSQNDRTQLAALVANRADLHLAEDTAGLHVRADNLQELTRLYSESSVKPLQIRPSNLEDVFLKLTGQEFSADA